MWVRLKVENQSDDKSGKISWQLEKSDYLAELLVMEPEEYDPSARDDEYEAAQKSADAHLAKYTTDNVEADE